jgi:signal transduction histidine kinase
VHRLRPVIAEQERLRAELATAVRVQEEFVAIAGHELRTPVTVIAGAAELLASKLPRSWSARSASSCSPRSVGRPPA